MLRVCRFGANIVQLVSPTRVHNLVLLLSCQALHESRSRLLSFLRPRRAHRHVRRRLLSLDDVSRRPRHCRGIDVERSEEVVAATVEYMSAPQRQTMITGTLWPQLSPLRQCGDDETNNDRTTDDGSGGNL
jgi:hypothetical protein